MARFTLRIDDDLFCYVQEQAKKENRSINEYFINLVQMQSEQETLENKIDLLDKKLEKFNNKNNMYQLKKALCDEKVISIVGKTRTGKSLLLNKIKEISIDNKFDTFDIKYDDYLNNNSSLGDFFAKIAQDLLMTKEEIKGVRIFIDDEDVINHPDFIKEYYWLINFLKDFRKEDYLEEEKEYAVNYRFCFCIVLPINFNYKDTHNHSLSDLLNFKIVTTKDNEDSPKKTYDYIRYSLDEIISLAF